MGPILYPLTPLISPPVWHYDWTPSIGDLVMTSETCTTSFQAPRVEEGNILNFLKLHIFSTPKSKDQLNLSKISSPWIAHLWYVLQTKWFNFSFEIIFFVQLFFNFFCLKFFFVRRCFLNQMNDFANAAETLHSMIWTKKFDKKCGNCGKFKSKFKRKMRGNWFANQWINFFWENLKTFKVFRRWIERGCEFESLNQKSQTFCPTS